MANIFQSTEIYKRLPNVQPSQNPLRAVRGMYASGTHRAPYYIDAGCLITAVETTPATVASYTERTDTLQDPGGINIIDVSCAAPTFQHYTMATSTASDPGGVNIIGVSCEEPQFMHYTSATQSAQDPGGINILSAEITAPVITNYQAEENRMNDFTVRIHSITTTHATVSNYN